MAIDFIPMGSTQQSQALVGALKAMNNGRDQLFRLFEIMQHCQDGSNFATLETQFGVPTGLGDELYNEMNSFVSKINTDASVANVLAAWNQISAKLGIS